jgi:membrane-associated phospholipid phosphatase
MRMRMPVLYKPRLARASAALASAVLASAFARDALAAPATPLDDVAADAADAFTGTNLLLYGAAVAETAGMAYGGGDHAVRVFAQRHLAAPAWGDAAYVAGYALPAFVAPGVWIGGLAARDDDAIGAGSAAVQALAMTLATTALLKWTTGRSYPLHGGDPRAPDVLDHPEYARAFAPFNLHGDWAWPSGHTSAITSVVAALSAWDPDHVAIPLVGYPVAAAIGLGMIDGDRHWTSDVVAGALIGYAIGHSVGASFRRRARGEREAAGGVRVVPMGTGVAIAGAW